MKTKTIRQTITLAASPNDVYEKLMDEKKYARFTGGAGNLSAPAITGSRLYYIRIPPVYEM